MKILFLDDSDDRRMEMGDNTFVLSKRLGISADVDMAITASEAIALLKKNTYDLVCLDHDLGDRVYVDSCERNTGAEVTRFIAENKDIIHARCFVLHSLNPAGVKYMNGKLQEAGFSANVIPFAWCSENLSRILQGVSRTIK